MNEAEFNNTYVGPKLRSWGAHAIRVENVAESGTPDWNYALESAQGWLESKILHGSTLYFEKFQIPWLQKRVRATGGHSAWVIACDKVYVYLFDAVPIVAAERGTYRKWTTIDVTKVPARIVERLDSRWDGVKLALTTPPDCLHSTESV